MDGLALSCVWLRILFEGLKRMQFDQIPKLSHLSYHAIAVNKLILGRLVFYYISIIMVLLMEFKLSEHRALGNGSPEFFP